MCCKNRTSPKAADTGKSETLSTKSGEVQGEHHGGVRVRDQQRIARVGDVFGDAARVSRMVESVGVFKSAVE